MPDGLQFVLILPDGSKSLMPADWKIASGIAVPYITFPGNGVQNPATPTITPVPPTNTPNAC